MTEVDESLLTIAKLREIVQGEIDKPNSLHPHAGVVEDIDHRNSLSFCESMESSSDFADSRLGQIVGKKIETDLATESVVDNRPGVASHLVGITEQDLTASALSLPLDLLAEMENNEAPSFSLAIGNPNAGKTNTMLLLFEIAKAKYDDMMLISNFNSSLTDQRIIGMHDLVCTLLEFRDVPKFVIVDEGSTHYDARTYRREVATQWTPLAKRFAKLDVFHAGIIGHTGKDLHPETKRMATMPFYKAEKKTAEFYSRWPADSDFPQDKLFSGDLEELQKTNAEYDPDDASPWNWDLEPEIFTLDKDWSGLLKELQSRGPTS